MRPLTVSLFIGIIVGAMWLHTLPALTWLVPVLALAVGAVWLERRWLVALVLCIAMSLIGTMRVTQDMDRLAEKVALQEIENMRYNTTAYGSETSTTQSPDLRTILEQRLSHMRLSESAYAVTTAMTLGDRRYIAPELRQSYSDAGASHILALSGMHLAIVFVILTVIAMALPRYLYALPEYYVEHLIRRGRLGDGAPSYMLWILHHRPSLIRIRQVMMCVVIIGIWAYVVFVGAQPSAIRAAEMLTIATIGTIITSRISILDSLALSAFIMLLVSPLLLFDIGFQMSYAAVLGIALCYTPLNNVLRPLWLSHKKHVDELQFRIKLTDKPTSGKAKRELRSLRFLVTVVRWLWSGVSLSLSAQLLVLPLVAYYFQSLPAYGIITSFFVSVSTLIIVWTGILLLICCALFPSSYTIIGYPFAFVLSHTVDFQNAFLAWIAELPGASITIPTLSIAQIILVYIIIASVLTLFLTTRLSTRS